MSLTRPIPPEAGPALAVLRRHERPKELPHRDHNAVVHAGGRYLTPLRWCDEGDHTGGINGHEHFCPLGLYTEAKSACPKPADVPGVPAEAAEAFMRWWDEQTDARAAVEEVWPA